MQDIYYASNIEVQVPGSQAIYPLILALFYVGSIKVLVLGNGGSSNVIKYL